MLYFRPISYSDADLRAFKFTTAAAASVREGTICYAVAGGLNVMIATPWTGSTVATVPMSAATIPNPVNVGKYFPIFREDLDIESISGTIAAGEYCVGFNLQVGNQFEVHSSLLNCKALASITAGRFVTLGTGSYGKYTQHILSQSTPVVLGMAVGTFGGKYLRVRVV